jgi:uncharacterized membrane protein HdeD (DUF308 family)
VSSRGRDAYRVTTLVFSVALIVLGVAALIRTAVAGGSATALGYVIGLGLLAAGVLRLWVLRKT